MASGSGKDGSVSLGGSSYGEAVSWTFDDGVDAEQYGCFGGGGFKKGSTGNRFGTGTVEVKQDFADPIEDHAEPGDVVSLVLVEGSGSTLTIGSAQITGLTPNVDGDTGRTVTVTIRFQTNGSYSYG